MKDYNVEDGGYKLSGDVSRNVMRARLCAWGMEGPRKDGYRWVSFTCRSNCPPTRVNFECRVRATIISRTHQYYLLTPQYSMYSQLVFLVPKPRVTSCDLKGSIVRLRFFSVCTDLWSNFAK